jgi:hypothetical protein
MDAEESVSNKEQSESKEQPAAQEQSESKGQSKPSTSIVDVKQDQTNQNYTPCTTLAEAESKISQGFNAFWIAAAALRDIRNGKLYKTIYASFPDYLAARWKITESYVSRLITAFETRSNLLTIEDVSSKEDRLPTAYSFFYTLSRLSFEEQKHVLMTMLAEEGKLTAEKLQEIVGKTISDDDRDTQRLRVAISTIKSLADGFDPANFFKGKNKGSENRQAFIQALRTLLLKLEQEPSGNE